MRQHFVCAAVVVLIAGSWSHGGQSKKSTIKTLRAEIKQLRAAEKIGVKEIGAWYQALIVKLENPEHKLQAIRTELRSEEAGALKNAKSSAEKKQIRKRYGDVYKVLTGDIKSDANAIKQLKQQRKTEEKLFKAVYTAKIKELENAIKLLEAGGKAKPRR
jgi:NDP-sugar pyrophosphorylase family protein